MTKANQNEIIFKIAAAAALLGVGSGILACANNGPSKESNLKCVGEHCLINGGTEFNKKYKAGDAVELTLTAENETYMLPTLPEVTFGDRKAIYEEEYLYDFSTGKITFIMPEGEVNITASAIPPETEMTYVYDENKSVVYFYAPKIEGMTVETDWGIGKGWESTQRHDYKDDGAKPGDIFTIKIRNASNLVLCTGSSLFSEGDYAITEIKLGNQMTTLSQIGTSGDKDKISLEKIVLPNSMTAINPTALQYCSKLKSIAIPDSLANFEFESFCAHCTELTDVILPKNMAHISSSMFGWCTNLTHINFPGKLETIGDDSFIRCEKLEKIVLPSKLQNIVGETFSGCTNLKTIDLIAFTDATKLPTAGGATFNDIHEEAKFYVNTDEIRDKFIELGQSKFNSWPTDSNKYVVVNQ